MNWDLMDVIEATGATPSRLPERQTVLTGISTDTRALAPGNLFVALRGKRFDGHAFVDAAVGGGAAAVLVEDPAAFREVIPCLFVPNTLRAYGALAGAYRKSLKARVTAITGSTGKTTTKEMTAAILSRKYKVATTQKNENNRVGVPKTLLAIPPDTEAAVVEMGSSLPGEIALLTEIARPDTALLTNIAPVHLKRLGTISGVRMEKSALFWRAPGDALRCINRDDPEIQKIPLNAGWPILTFGTGKEAQIRAEGIEPMGLEGTRFTLVHEGERILIALPLLGPHQVRNALAAAAAGVAEGVSLTDIKAALESFQPLEKRLEPIVLSSGSVILNDTYNASPAATVLALETLAMFRGAFLTIALLGDMLELGENSAKYHEEVGARCARLGIERLGITGDYRESTRRGALKEGLEKAKTFFFDDADSLLENLPELGASPVMVLVKGSRALRMERFIDPLRRYFGEKGGTA